jgi:hypothetical protein
VNIKFPHTPTSFGGGNTGEVKKTLEDKAGLVGCRLKPASGCFMCSLNLGNGSAWARPLYSYGAPAPLATCRARLCTGHAGGLWARTQKAWPIGACGAWRADFTCGNRGHDTSLLSLSLLFIKAQTYFDTINLIHQRVSIVWSKRLQC